MPRSDGRFFVGRTYPWPAGRIALRRRLEGRRRRRRREPLQHGRRSRLGGGRRSRRHVVVAAVAIDAGHLAIGVLRAPPAAALGAVVLFVATEAGLGPGHRIARLETEDQPRFPALGFQVAAGRPVTAFARVAAMHVFGKRLGVGPVAVRAHLVVVDVFGAGDRRHRALDLLIGNLGEEGVAPRPAGIEIRLGAARRLVRRSAGDRHRQQQAYDQNRRDRTSDGVARVSRCPQFHLLVITGSPIAVSA